MKDLGRILREGDPARPDQELSPAHAAAMRRQMLSAVRVDVVRTPWQQPLAIAAMVALTIAAGVLVGLRFSAVEARPDVPAASAPVPPRQLQFSTPGGTRIIWVFDPEFQVKETVP